MRTEFTVFAEPAPQPRPRLGKGRVYNDPSADAYKTAVWVAWRKASKSRKPSLQPWYVKIDLYFAKTKRQATRSTDRHLPLPHTVKPDIDNVIKATLDALNGGPWKDDAQVCEIYVTKKRAAFGEKPRAEITIAELQS